MKKFLALILALVLVLSMVACSNGEDAADAADASPDASGTEATTNTSESNDTEAADSETAGGRTIGISTYSMSNTAIYPLIQSMIDGVTSRGDEYVLVSANGDSDTEGIVQTVEELVNRDDIDGIMVDNINDTVLTDVVAQANKKGIPMVFNDIPFADDPENPMVVANIMNDNYSAGEQIARRCAEDLGGEGNVIIYGAWMNAVMTDRTQAIYDVFEEYPGITVLYEGLVSLDVAEANANAEDQLMAYDDVDAILCGVDNTAIGTVAAIKQLGREGIKVYSIDGGSDICPLIKNGDVVMSVAQDFVAMGTATADALYAYLDGEEVEHDQTIPAPAITSENVDEWIDFFENTTYTFAQ